MCLTRGKRFCGLGAEIRADRCYELSSCVPSPVMSWLTLAMELGIVSRDEASTEGNLSSSCPFGEIVGWHPVHEVPLPFHPHELVVVEPRRALVRRADEKAPAALGPSKPPCTRSRPTGVDRNLERESPAVRVAKDRGRDPGVTCRILPAGSLIRVTSVPSG